MKLLILLSRFGRIITLIFKEPTCGKEFLQAWKRPINLTLSGSAFKLHNIGLLILILLLTQCKSADSVAEILARHNDQIGISDQIKTIQASATCEGPNGPYDTYTASAFADDYLYFKQTFAGNQIYRALIMSASIAFDLDSLHNPTDTLPKSVISVLKSHKFHELSLQLEERYNGMIKRNDTIYFDIPCHQLQAKDKLNEPVRLFFNKETGLMAGFSQINPFKKEEVISTYFYDWEKVNEMLLFDKIILHQGQEAKYTFDYYDIAINASDFQKITIN
ncbi:MAG: hypothetical protein JXR03_02605 [Cyclobacteriaceae bacterium]